MVQLVSLHLLLLLPVAYLIQQNFDLFLNLAHLQAPELIDHLERERSWALLLLSLCWVGSLGVGYWVNRRWALRLLRPVEDMREHLDLLSRGYWYAPQLRLPDPEMKQVADTYNYFYRSLQLLTRHQLRELEGIRTAAGDPQSHRILQKLIQEARQRLVPDLPDRPVSADAVTFSPGAGSEPSPAERRVS